MSGDGLGVSSDEDDNMLHDENKDMLDDEHEDVLEASMSVAMLPIVVSDVPGARYV